MLASRTQTKQAVFVKTVSTPSHVISLTDDPFVPISTTPDCGGRDCPRDFGDLVSSLLCLNAKRDHVQREACR